jgi:hypothetical protein
VYAAELVAEDPEHLAHDIHILQDEAFKIGGAKNKHRRFAYGLGRFLPGVLSQCGLDAEKFALPHILLHLFAGIQLYRGKNYPSDLRI